MNSHFLTTIFVSLGACLSFGSEGLAPSGELDRIAFGSCLRQHLPAPIWGAVADSKPDVWIWLGDNIYGDTADPEVLASAYGWVKASPGYTVVKEMSTVLGTWDDHDYGKNDGGKEWKGKAAAQVALLDFLDEPSNSARRKQDGVYWTYDFGSGDRKVRIVLLDVRFHRDSPSAPQADILGEGQKIWLESLLEEDDAAITLIASGTQVISEEHRYESWAKFPQSRAWLYDLVKRKAKSRVIILSGDRHFSEISMENIEGYRWPLVDITSSSLTHSWTSFSGEPNRHRVGEVFFQNNFGLIEIDWVARSLDVTIRDVAGEVGLEQRLSF